MSLRRRDNRTGYTLQYYDLVLCCIASSHGLGALIGYATPVAIELSVAVLGVAAIRFVAHALFINGPVDETADLTEELEVEEVPQARSPVDRRIELRFATL